jgi:hypothetical protein
LYQDLAELTWFEKSQNIHITNSNRHQVVEILRAISELIVYGAQGPDCERIFDYFCEKNMLSIFTRMLAARPGCGDSVKRQIIQTMSILVQNISNDTYFYYLLSNNHINEIISHPFDLSNEDVLAHYVSFLKMLSLKLNTNTVQFFFNHATESFPLFTEASKLIVHPENMVRTHIRNLTLNVYRVAASEGNVREYLRTNSNGFVVLEKLAYWLRDQSNILGRFLQVNGGTIMAGSHSPERIKEMANDVIDEIYYIQDVFSTNIPGVQAKLSDSMLENVYFPVLIDGLRNIHSNGGGEVDGKSWGPDCCVDGDEAGAHGRGAMGSLLAMFLLTQSLLVLNSKRLSSAIAAATIGLEPVRLVDWIVGAKSSGGGVHGGGAAGGGPNGRALLSTAWQAPPPLRLGRGQAIDFAGGAHCKNPSRRALFGHLCSGDDRHVLLSLCFLNALMKSTAVNQSIIRRAGLVSRSKATEHSLLDELMDDKGDARATSLGDRSGRNGNDSSIFDDKEDTIVHTPPSLKQVFGSSSISSVDGLVGEEENAEEDGGKGEGEGAKEGGGEGVAGVAGEDAGVAGEEEDAGVADGEGHVTEETATGPAASEAAMQAILGEVIDRIPDVITEQTVKRTIDDLVEKAVDVGELPASPPAPEAPSVPSPPQARETIPGENGPGVRLFILSSPGPRFQESWGPDPQLPEGWTFVGTFASGNEALPSETQWASDGGANVEEARARLIRYYKNLVLNECIKTFAVYDQAPASVGGGPARPPAFDFERMGFPAGIQAAEETVEYPVGIVGALITALYNVASRPGLTRIITLRSLIATLTDFVSPQSGPRGDGKPAAAGEEAATNAENSDRADGTCFLPRHALLLETALERCGKGLRTVLEQFGTLQRQKNIFVELFHAELNSRQRDTMPLDLLSGRSSILLPVPKGAKSGVDMESRLPLGEAESVRWCLRTYFIVRKFLYGTLKGEADVSMQGVLELFQGSVQCSSNRPQQEVVDFAAVEYVPCRLPADPTSGPRDIFFVLQDNFLAVAEPVDVKPSQSPTVLSCLITPIRSVESVSVDHNDSRILRITFRSHLLVVSGARRGSTPSTPTGGRIRSSSVSSGTQWHLTCSFESLENCEWVREKLEAATMYLRTAKMHKIRDLLGLEKLLDPAKAGADGPATPKRPVDRDGSNGATPTKQVGSDDAQPNSSPTKQNAFQHLLSMGFTEEEHGLRELLERHDGRVEAVVEFLVNK